MSAMLANLNAVHATRPSVEPAWKAELRHLTACVQKALLMLARVSVSCVIHFVSVVMQLGAWSAKTQF
jgi:hypothetical protein